MRRTWPGFAVGRTLSRFGTSGRSDSIRFVVATSTTTTIRRFLRFYWNSRLWSAVSNTSNCCHLLDGSDFVFRNQRGELPGKRFIEQDTHRRSEYLERPQALRRPAPESRKGSRRGNGPGCRRVPTNTGVPPRISGSLWTTDSRSGIAFPRSYRTPEGEQAPNK